jgi:acetyl esterase
MRWFFDCYTRAGSDPADPSISPLRADELRPGAAASATKTGTAERIAPALVITAEHDPLRDEGEAYAAALRARGVEVTLTRYDGMIHAFFGLGAVFDAANDAMAEVGSALHAAFGTL